MPDCPVRDIHVYYRAINKDFRSNIPVLFIHGAGASLHVWANQLQEDIPGFCQIALDLPGHARSQGHGEEYIQDYVDWITAFIRAMGFEQCILAGHSMGGAISQLAALTQPELFLALVLVGTGARLRVAGDVLARARNGESFAEYAYAAKTSQALQLEAEKEFNLTAAEVRYHDFLACDRFDIMHRVQDIQHPALVICGQEDYLTPVKYSQYLHEHLPSSRLELIPGAGHMVMWEQAQAVNRALRDFLNAIKE